MRGVVAPSRRMSVARRSPEGLKVLAVSTLVVSVRSVRARSVRPLRSALLVVWLPRASVTVTVLVAGL